MVPSISYRVDVPVARMHVALAFAVLFTLAHAESAPLQPVSQSAARFVFALGSMAIVVWLATVVTVATVRAVRHDFSQRNQWLREFGYWQRICLGLWLGIVFAIEYLLRWPQMVRTNWQLGESVLVDELLILVPVMMPLLLMWAVEFELDWSIRIGGRHERWRLRLLDRVAFVVARSRHYFVLTLLPVLALLGTRDVVQRWFPEIVAGRYAWLVYTAPAVAVLVCFPWVLRAACATERLADGPLRTRLESSARRWKVGFREILVWRTDGRLVNAAVTGWLPHFRYVFLTDGLLQLLDHAQVEAVFAHEAGHARLFHVGRRLLTVVLPVLLWQAAVSCQVAPHGFGAGPLSDWFDAISPAVPVFVIGAYVLVTLGWYSRRLEYQADLWACSRLREMLAHRGEDQDAVARYVSALERIAQASFASRRQAAWLHPSLQSRIDFLLTTATDRSRTHVFHRRVRMAEVLLLAAAASPLLLLLLLAS